MRFTVTNINVLFKLQRPTRSMQSAILSLLSFRFHARMAKDTSINTSAKGKRHLTILRKDLSAARKNREKTLCAMQRSKLADASRGLYEAPRCDMVMSALPLSFASDRVFAWNTSAFEKITG